MRRLHFKYNSYSETVKAALQPPIAEVNRAEWEREKNGDNGRSPRFYGWNNEAVPSIEKLSDFFIAKGWPEGVEKMRANMTKVDVPVVASVRRRQAWQEQGTELSRDRLYSGHDNFWRGRIKQSVNITKKIRIVFDICVGANIKSEDMFWVGAAGITLAEALIDAGHQVELLATAATRQDDEEYRLSTIVKAFDQPFNYSTTLAITGHASFFRQIWFTHQPAHTDKVWHGKGSVVRVPVDPVDEDGVTQIQATHMTSASEANAWVARTIASLGVADAA